MKKDSKAKTASALPEMKGTLDATIVQQWTRETLRPDDYSFAISEERIEWKSQTHVWPTQLVMECLRWELDRELRTNSTVPFVQACAGRITELIAAVKPLREAVGSEIGEVVTHPVSLISSATWHVLQIDHTEKTEDTIQRFRNWLNSKRETWPSTLTTTGEIVHKAGAGRVIGYPNVELRFRDKEFKNSRSPKADLRALAVRRLKRAGYTRREAAELLKIKDSYLGRDQWKDLPKRADKLLSDFVATRTNPIAETAERKQRRALNKKAFISDALLRCSSSVPRTAEFLKVTEDELRTLMKRLGLRMKSDKTNKV